MKKNIIIGFLSVLTFFGLFTVGCDDNIPPLNVDGVPVDSIRLKDSFKSRLVNDSLILEAGDTANIALQVEVFPENATDLAESFYSSDVDVATVTAKGILNANMEGESEITIMVGGHEATFMLKVLAKVVIPATSIEFAMDNIEVMIGREYDLFNQLVIEPLEANDGVDFVSSDPTILSIDAEGIATGLKEGTVTVTASSKANPEISATTTATVSRFQGDYDRASWTMTASQDLSGWTSTGEGNSLQAALDGSPATNFCLVKPGKTYGGITNTDEPLWFVIDMKVQQPVSYFRIKHRQQDMTGLRWRGFERIEGSNDGETFELIGEDVMIPESDWNEPNRFETSNVDILAYEKSYRYIRFYASSAGPNEEYFARTDRGTVQIEEIYLGIEWE